MRTPPGIARLESFGRVDSTQRVVRGWLDAGADAPCIAMADEQTAGRGRLDRRWQAPSGAALLLSVGLRPASLDIGRAWRVPAALSLALREAIVASAGIDRSRLRLKWPNDLVGLESGGWRKLAGVLTEGVPEGGRMDILVIGLGVDVDWARRDFPAELAASMTSLREMAGRPTDRDALAAAFLGHIAAQRAALEEGRLDEDAWLAAQLTTGASVEVETGSARVRGTGLDPDRRTGALRIEVDGRAEPVTISVGDVVRCRVGAVGRGV